MCIILTCDPGIKPTHDLIESCFDANPDGAGLMWCESGKVQISKGYMDPDTLFKCIESTPKESPLAVHMRIATSGGISAGTCHPYPICDCLEALHASDVKCGAALMHNGMISGMPTDDQRGISDTVSFVSNVVTPLLARYKHVTSAMRRDIMRAAPGNRFALLTSDAKLVRIGAGWCGVSRGIQASNQSWRRRTYARSAAYGDDYIDFLDDYCGTCEYYATCAAFGPLCDDLAADAGLYESYAFEHMDTLPLWLD